MNHPFFSFSTSESLTLELEFWIEKVINMLSFTDCKSLQLNDLNLINTKQMFEGLEILKPGSQTLFISKCSLSDSHQPPIIIKPYHISHLALIQYLASYLYMKTNIKQFVVRKDDVQFIISPANCLYFLIFNYSVGETNKIVPILVQDEVKENIANDNQSRISRKDFFFICKVISSEGFSFDPYPSN